jgi:hypothetical protein
MGLIGVGTCPAIDPRGLAITLMYVLFVKSKTGAGPDVKSCCLCSLIDEAPVVLV